MVFARVCVFLFAAALAALSPPVTAGDSTNLYFVDAHSQIDQKLDDINIVLRRMEENGVRTTILAARGGREDSDIVRLARKSDGRVVAAIRTKGGKYARDKPQFYRKLEKQSGNGKFGAIAEVLMFHAQKGGKADEVNILPSDQRVRAALDAARRNHWPFVAHIEFAALAPEARDRFRSEFEAMLAEDRNQAVLLIHMGQLQANEAEILLARHSNLYLLTSHADPFTVDTSSQPWTNLFENGKLKPQWQVLMKKYPDRFVFALDNVWAHHWRTEYSKKVKLWRAALLDLPPNIANKIAHGNAERLYGLR